MKLFSLLSLSALALGATLKVQIPSSQQLPNPATLPATTSATLTTLSNVYTASLGSDNSFSFRNVTPGSYLLDIHCPTHSFAAQRVDVHNPDAPSGDVHPKVEVWTSFRGNEWSNKGEIFETKLSTGGKELVHVFDTRSLGPKAYFYDRPKFSPLSLLKNPMILIGGVSMIIILGMPYLLDSMDPEMRAEFEAQQKSSPLTGALTGQQAGANPLQGFDAAAWLAGAKQPKSNADGNTSQEKRIR